MKWGRGVERSETERGLARRFRSRRCPSPACRHPLPVQGRGEEGSFGVAPPSFDKLRMRSVGVSRMRMRMRGGRLRRRVQLSTTPWPSGHLLVKGGDGLIAMLAPSGTTPTPIRFADRPSPQGGGWMPRTAAAPPPGARSAPTSPPFGKLRMRGGKEALS
jgi:hypothetical protein